MDHDRLQRLHALRISHGDVYAHNVMVRKDKRSPLLPGSYATTPTTTTVAAFAASTAAAAATATSKNEFGRGQGLGGGSSANGAAGYGAAGYGGGAGSGVEGREQYAVLFDFGASFFYPDPALASPRAGFNFFEAAEVDELYLVT